MYTRLLHHVARYIPLDDAAAQIFCNALELKQLRKHQYLLQEGDICKRDHFVIKGGLRQYEVDMEGRERITHFGFEDWWITDRYSLLTQTPSVYNIEALEVTEVLQINMDTLEALYIEIPVLERYFHKVLQQAFAVGQKECCCYKSPPKSGITHLWRITGRLNSGFPSSI